MSVAKEKIENGTLGPKDFATDQEVRWCPGCGDYAILKGVQRTLAELQVRPENTVFISGIGCAARFPYYMETYGFHTIHGRAPAFATGVKLANPDLDVWIVAGDGDALSIGGNHTLHVLRRNVNLQFLLFNNEIYGLTKGQYSPTSKRGARTPSSPLGTLESPVSACLFALGSGGRFIARCVDTDQKHLPGLLKRAHVFDGAAFLEIFQNCIVFNDDCFSSFTDRDVAADMQVMAEHGKPLIYGKERNRGLRFNSGSVALEAVTIGENGVGADDILVHDETNRLLANALAALEPPAFPVVMGVIYCDPAESYDKAVAAQVAERMAAKPDADLGELLRGGATWTVE